MQPITCDLWLMEPAALRQFSAMLTGELPLVKSEAQSPRRQQKRVAILPLHGVIEPRASLLSELFGNVSTERFGAWFDAAMADDSVTGIVMDIASPGGMAYGIPELASKIYAARGTKPVLAVANPVAASGAYWVASAADRVIVTPSSDVGSVGVYNTHLDISKALEMKGIKETIVRSTGSPFKAESLDSEPLTDAARENRQSRADRIYSDFTADLSKFRGVSIADVRENFGKGRLVDARAAIASGMADRIGTLDDTAIRLATGRIRLGGASAEDTWDGMSLMEERRERSRPRIEALMAKAGTN